MLGKGSNLGNGEGVNELGRMASVGTESGSSCAALELEGKGKQKGWQKDLESGSDDVAERMWVTAKWSGPLGGCEMHQRNLQNT